MFGRHKCPACEGSKFPFRGNGKCGKCFGTGVNVVLSAPDPKCEACDGTGICHVCGGTGVVEGAVTVRKTPTKK